jgi:head-tail adaptor
MYRPKEAQQMTTPIRIQHRVKTDVNGAPDVSYQDADPALDFCNWKGKGGTESIQAGTIIILNTAELTMWYRPDISEQDQILLNDDAGLAYEVKNVENVEMRNQFLMLKVCRTVND